MIERPQLDMNSGSLYSRSDQSPNKLGGFGAAHHHIIKPDKAPLVRNNTKVGMETLSIQEFREELGSFEEIFEGPQSKQQFSTSQKMVRRNRMSVPRANQPE